MYIALYMNGKMRTLPVAHLVLDAFVGVRPTLDHSADHINHDPLDNSADNLRWATRDEQMANTNRKGERSPNSKLTADKVRVIKGLLTRDVAVQDLAILVDVTPEAISAIKHGKTWAHVLP